MSVAAAKAAAGGRGGTDVVQVLFNLRQHRRRQYRPGGRGAAGADWRRSDHRLPVVSGNGRTIYTGHLFVGDALLSDSPMKDHPLTPMHDANLVRVLGRQTTLPVGLVTIDTIAQGEAAVRHAFAAARGGREAHS